MYGLCQVFSFQGYSVRVSPRFLILRVFCFVPAETCRWIHLPLVQHRCNWCLGAYDVWSAMFGPALCFVGFIM